MRLKEILFLLTFFPALIHAQVLISVQLPPAGMVQKDQLWNVMIANNSTNEYETKILLSLQDVVTGQSVLTGSTAPFFLGKGMKVLSSRELQPILYNYITAGSGSDFLPLGNYIACYTLYRVQLDAVEKIAEECVRLSIAPLSPPQLITPLDKSRLLNGLPQFTWTAPAPLDLFTELNYDLMVTEVLPSQTPVQALQYNSSLYSRSGLKATFEPYPSTFSKLEAGKTYAWQVVARNGINYRAATEVWTFTLADDSITQPVLAPSYVLLKSNRDEASLTYVTDTLYVQHYSYNYAGEATLQFFTSAGKLLEERKQAMIYGDNYLRLPIGHRYQRGILYRLSLVNQIKQTYTAFFTIK